MQRSLPVFKYHPKPLETEMITKSTTVCSVCQEETEYVYEGPFFAIEEVEDICPWCIKSGAATLKYDGDFQDAASCESGFNNDQLDELIHRTPGYSGWQQEYWLSHCNDFCAFLGYVGWEEIKDISNELIDDLISYGYNLDETKQYLRKNGNLQGYLFQCLTCGKHRIHIDCD